MKLVIKSAIISTIVLSAMLGALAAFGGDTGDLNVKGKLDVADTLTVSGYMYAGTEVDSETSYHPKIKIKKITGTTGVNEGDSVTIPHNLTAARIISMSCVAWAGTSDGFIPGTNTAIGFSGYEYYAWIAAAVIYVKNHSDNSENIKNKPITITLIYEEE